MANEITIQASLSVNKSGVAIGGTLAALSITQVGTNSIGSVQNINTTTEQLTFGDVSTIGYLFVKNLDATNYVEISGTNPVGAEAFAKLLPGEAMLVPTRLTAIYAKANTAACDCLVVAVEL